MPLIKGADSEAEEQHTEFPIHKGQLFCRRTYAHYDSPFLYNFCTISACFKTNRVLEQAHLFSIVFRNRERKPPGKWEFWLFFVMEHPVLVVFAKIRSKMS
jgi:hypothetical protein